MKLTLIPEIKKFHTFLSVQLNAVLAVIASLSPLVLGVWTNMPADVKAVLPANVTQAVAYTIIFLSLIAARVVTTQAAVDKAAAVATAAAPAVEAVAETADVK